MHQPSHQATTIQLLTIDRMTQLITKYIYCVTDDLTIFIPFKEKTHKVKSQYDMTFVSRKLKVQFSIV